MNIIITCGVATLYAKPSIESETVTQALLGDTVERIAQSGDWYSIRTADGYRCWCHKVDLICTSENYPQNSVVARVSALWASLYPSKSIKTKPARVAPFNATLEVEEGDEEWLRLRMPDKTQLYGRKSDFSFDLGLHTTNEMIEQALKFVGIPYLWGGCSPKGFDCSGFVQLLFSLRGIKLPRDAKDQALLGETAEKLKSGDLLFFGDPIGHVGIFLGGDSYIHASQCGNNAVQISKLSGQYIAKRLS